MPTKLTPALLLLCVVVVHASLPDVGPIQRLISAVSARRAARADHKGKERLTQWAYDWLSVLGWYKGQTAMLKDYTFNYTNRNFGPLVRFVKEMISEIGPNHSPTDIVLRLRVLLNIALDHFNQDGPIRNCLLEIEPELQDAHVGDDLVSQPAVWSEFLQQMMTVASQAPLPEPEL
eukprot:gnl/Spiro4/12320_TR6500_c0_g1_i1.p1 gnl/Spiro4/12320_TR6500_c0_g1~~gnl/Spiro4/12320_TR6500_c0_g1_i1.p1  ORF type:complete len:189 (-),score=17.00 gnl/Spiro4/12320_TR6500_c0_g1_i1:116-643(-)